MSGWGDPDLLPRLLDEQVEFMRALPDHRRMVFLAKLLRWLQEDPHLAQLLADLAAEEMAAVAGLEEEERELRRTIRKLWNRNKQRLEKKLHPVKKDRKLNLYASTGDFARRVGNEPAVVFPSREIPTRDRSEVDKLIRALKHWADWGADGVSIFQRRDRFAGLAQQAEALLIKRRRQFRAFRSLCMNESFVALKRLSELSRRANPPAPNDAMDDEVFADALSEYYGNDPSLADEIHDPLTRVPNRPGWRGLDVAAKQALDDVELLFRDLRVRVLVGRSRVGLLRRYAARCEGFEKSELVKLVGASDGEVEEALTLDLARFLFAHGLNPLVDPKAKHLRPDLLDPALQPAMYVEVKQFEKPTKAPLRKAVGQVFDTWRVLRNQYEIPEAALVVFIWGDRGVELPTWIAREGKRLLIQVVDLGDSSQRGSRSRTAPLELGEKDLLPGRQE